MSDILTRIESYKREEIAAAKSLRPWNEVVAEAHDAPPVRRFLSALKRKRDAGHDEGAAVNKEPRGFHQETPRGRDDFLTLRVFERLSS